MGSQDYCVGDCRPSIMSGRSPVNYGQKTVLDFGNVGGLGQLLKASLIQARGEDCGTEMVTVTLGVEWQDGEIFAGALKALAIVRWGTGNADCSAEIDFKEGTQFAVPASFLEIGVQAVGISVGTVTFAANISWGSGSRTYATRTVDRITIPAGGNLRFRIPRFACRFFPLPANAAGAATTWTLEAVPGEIWYAGTTATANLVGAEIPGPVKFCNITGAPGAEVTPLFLLSL
jgi:hypothetical protein